MGGGWLTDRTGIRKPIGLIGYGVMSLATGALAFAQSWRQVLCGRVIAWSARGLRTPVRDALVAEAVEPAYYGRAYGLERAMDTIGAIAGPLLALWLLGHLPLRHIFLWTLVPGSLAVASFGSIVGGRRVGPDRVLTLRGSWQGLPPNFKRYLIGVGLFGLGDFAHTLLILRATELLTPSHGAVRAGAMAIGLYAVHNGAYAIACLVSGHLGDRWGRRRVLACGYSLSALMCVGLLIPVRGLWPLALLFLIGGAFVGVEETLERAVAAEVLPADLRGTGFGVLATINGLGDFASSAVVGFLWQAIHPALGFVYAGLLSALGSVFMWSTRERPGPE